MSTLLLISVMCSVAMYFIRPHLIMPGMVLVLGPIVMMLSTVANYCLTTLEIFPLNKYDQWLICSILSATIGIVVGLCLAAYVARMIDKADAKSPRLRKA